MNFSGTATDAFSHMFEGVEQVDCYFKGEIPLCSYERFIEESESSICFSTLQRHLLYLSSRYPKKVDQFDHDLLTMIPNKSKISEEDLNTKFNIYKELVGSVFKHDNYLT